MGRKIPAKKHRGVKDPLQQQAKRLQSLKGKINAPPADPDEQPVPRSVMRLFNLAPKNKTITKPKPKLHHTERAPKPAGLSMRRAEGETARSFSLRINNAVRQIKDTTGYDDIQEEERRDHRGERIAELREKRKKKKKMKGGQEEKEGDDLSRKARRRKEQHEKKKAKEAEKLQSQSEIRYESVAFGEVVHAPPALLPRRHKPSAGAVGAVGAAGAAGAVGAVGAVGALPATQGPCGRRGLLLAAMFR